MLKVTGYSTYLIYDFHQSLHLEGSIPRSIAGIKKPLKN